MNENHNDPCGHDNPTGHQQNQGSQQNQSNLNSDENSTSYTNTNNEGDPSFSNKSENNTDSNTEHIQDPCSTQSLSSGNNRIKNQNDQCKENNNQDHDRSQDAHQNQGNLGRKENSFSESNFDDEIHRDFSRQQQGFQPETERNENTTYGEKDTNSNRVPNNNPNSYKNQDFPDNLNR